MAHGRRGGLVALKKIRIVAAVAAGCLLLTGLTGCSAQPTGIRPAAFDTTAVSQAPEGGIVAENSRYRLEWDDAKKTVALTDIQRGTRFSTDPAASAEPEYDELGMPVKSNPMLSSALQLKYIDAVSGHEVSANSYNGAVRNGRVLATTLEDGLLVTYYFDEIQVAVPVEYRLRETGLAVTVRTKQLQEGENRVTELSLLPFMCAVENTAQDAYLFLPSGSGALVYPKTLSATGVSYRQSIYGDDPMIEVFDSPSVEAPVRLPVYGAKNGDTALCAVVEEGAESAMLDALIGGSSYRYSAAYATLRLRGYANLRVKAYTGNIIQSDYYTEDIVDTTLTVTYTPLYDAQADYIGMAGVYRSYLQTAGLLTGTDSASAPYTLYIYGGLMSKQSFLGIPHSTMTVLTDTKQAETMLRELSEATGQQPAVYLKGFGGTGLTTGKLAGGYTVNSRLGGVKGLNTLSAYCRESSIPLYFNVDLLRFRKSSGGWNKLTSSAQAANMKNYYPVRYSVSLRSKNTGTKYALLTREKLADATARLLKKTAGWQVEGLAFDTLADTAYSDYGTGYYCQQGMAQTVTDALAAVQNSGRRVAVSEANGYAAAAAEQVFNVPLSSAKYDVFDEDVPFYAAVFKGHTALSTPAIDLATRPQDALLAAMEAGCAPTWSLMYRYDTAVLNCTTAELHAGVYAEWKDAIVQTVKEVAPFYAAIAGAEITAHRLLEGGVRVTEFSNGVQVAVNRSDTAQPSPLGTVGAWSYRIGGITG